MDMKIKYYQQKFALEVDYCVNLLLETFNNKSYLELLETETKSDVADTLGIGLPKLDMLLDYSEFLGLTDNGKITELAKSIRKMKYNLDFIEPLFYYKLTRDPHKGGHYYYSKAINEGIYNQFIGNYENKVNQSQLIKDAEKYLDDKPKDWEKMFKTTLNVLSNPTSGFGKFGLFEVNEKNKNEIIFEIHSYWVEPLVAAYIIYDIWEENQTTMEISKIINDKYNLGRIFLMDESAVMEILDEIQGMGLLNIETIAGLDQIRIDKNISKEDILNMMIERS